ncbi:MAG: ribosomal protein S6 modification protein [Bacteroidia bacterium]|nr:MAG: ribosomal protein S6 modification protein [Bacteroidia bacterium]
MKNRKKEKSIIGRRELVDFPGLNIFGIEAKIDTGAYSSALHCEYINEKNGQLCFQIFKNTDIVCMDNFEKKKIKNSFGDWEERYIIKTVLKIGKRKIRITLSLTNREKMKYPVLLGRKAIKGKFLVDVEKKHLTAR